MQAGLTVQSNDGGRSTESVTKHRPTKNPAAEAAGFRVVGNRPGERRCCEPYFAALPAALVAFSTLASTFSRVAFAVASICDLAMSAMASLVFRVRPKAS